MTSFASLLLLAQLAAVPSDTMVPAALSARVQDALASTWQVAPSRVTVTTGGAVRWRPADAEAPLRLGTVSREGWLVVTLEPVGMAPRAVRLRAGVRRDVPVAARALASGTLLGAEDIGHAARVQWGAPVASEASDPLGWEVRRALRPGDALQGIVIAPPPAVASGEAMRIVWQQRGVAIEMDAVALTAARLGERVQARTATGRVTARMTGPGVARIEGELP
jgi:flagella basal body P-ring formation protein FlgA